MLKLTPDEAKKLYIVAKDYNRTNPSSVNEVQLLIVALERGNEIGPGQYNPVLYVLAWARSHSQDLTLARVYTKIIDKVHAAKAGH